jgi:Family of unknown function (DUF6152)
MDKRLVAALAAVSIVTAAPAFPHHSNSAFDVEKVIELKGTVREFKWANPHTWIFLTVDDGKGAKQDWQVEGRPPGVLGRAGWTRTSLKPGDTISVYCSPAKDGSHTALVARVILADGTVLPNAPEQ